MPLAYINPLHRAIEEDEKLVRERNISINSKREERKSERELIESIDSRPGFSSQSLSIRPILSCYMFYSLSTGSLVGISRSLRYN
jgi:hypothetical protein